MIYRELLRNFWKKHEEKPFTHAEITLYFALLNSADNNDWKPFKQSSIQLSNFSNISRPTVIKARKSLQERGLIIYSESNKSKSEYIIIGAEELETTPPRPEQNLVTTPPKLNENLATTPPKLQQLENLVTILPRLEGVLETYLPKLQQLESLETILPRLEQLENLVSKLPRPEQNLVTTLSRSDEDQSTKLPRPEQNLVPQLPSFNNPLYNNMYNNIYNNKDLIKDIYIDRSSKNFQNQNETKPTKPTKQKSFKQLSKDEFYQSLIPFLPQYGKNLVRDFFNYWTEPSASGTPRFQLEKTWDTSLRLSTWKRNQSKFNPTIETPKRQRNEL